MFTNASCTVWEKAERNRSPTYVKHEYAAVYWEDIHGQSDGKDRDPENKALIVIHASQLGYFPKPDDRIICGHSDSESYVPDALTVASVSDRLYGSPTVQHIEIIAK